MKAKPKYLTKSLFKSAVECPTKLFYKKKKDQYEDESLDDPFLEALARGGFQVGALAQLYFPNGVMIDALEHDEALRQTEELLKKDEVVIYEAALKHGNKFIRVDILKKKGKVCELIEVKSKSVDPETFREEIWNKRSKSGPKLNATWSSYLFDVAFQTLVARKARQDLTFTPFLMCADKTKCASVDGLNQKFLLKKDANGQLKVILQGNPSLSDLGNKILAQLDIANEINTILNDKEKTELLAGKTFTEAVAAFEEAFKENRKIEVPIGSQCKGCEFRSEPIKEKSGFEECWTTHTSLGVSQLRNEPLVLDLWDNRSSQKHIEEHKVYLLSDLQPEDLNHKESENPDEELSRTARQLLQIEVAREGRKSEVVKNGLSTEVNCWNYPFHFIDFETCMVAIPFSAGRRPYEQVAFQFSHHVLDKDGRVYHRSQYLHSNRGEFPNFHFVRALKNSLSGDEGTIFRYADHENTVLNQIYDQLAASNEPDREDLMTFIKTITTRKEKEDGGEAWEGRRSMVDLLKLVKKHYYHPRMGGSNSLKYVLPAILNASSFLKERYSKPIYGKGLEISSLNYETPKTWVKFDGNSEVLDPYKELESILDGYTPEELDRLLMDDDVRNGGAAMTAYAMMQFTEMSPKEHQRLHDALLRYCELDTLAMVMVVQHWQSLFNQAKRKVG